MLLSVERLDDRVLLDTHIAHYLIVDCTPSLHTAPGTTETFDPGRFSAIFARGQGPDSNGDGVHDLRDLGPCIDQMQTQVQALYASVGYKVKFVDRNCQSQAGLRWLRVAQQHPEITVQVCYLSDSAPNNIFWSGVVGISYLPPAQSNLDWYDFVFARPLVGVPDRMFTTGIAVAIAHELGHLNGLLHPQNTADFTDVMNAFISDQPWLDRFSHVDKVVDDGSIQNAHKELIQGWTQPNVWGGGSTYFFARTPGNISRIMRTFATEQPMGQV